MHEHGADEPVKLLKGSGSVDSKSMSAIPDECQQDVQGLSGEDREFIISRLAAILVADYEASQALTRDMEKEGALFNRRQRQGKPNEKRG